MKVINAGLSAMMLAVLSACTWVKPSVESQSVVLAQPSEVVECTKKGYTTSKTLSKITLIPRNEEKIFTELVMLAKNEAVILGGNTVVPEPAKEAGERTFAVYTCP